MPEIHALPLANIEADPDQPRKIFRQEDMAQLTGSMRESGLIQPITVRSIAGGYRIIAGERRFRAACDLDWDTIDAVVRDDLSEPEVLAAQVIENIGRADMTPIEEGRAYRRLLDHGWSVDQITLKLGLPQWQAQWRIDLLQLIPQVQELVEIDAVKPRVARYLVKLTEAGQSRALKRLSHEEMNDGQVAAMVDAIYAEENGIEMFPDLATISRSTHRTLATYDEKLHAAINALRALAAIDDVELQAALAASLPATINRTAAVRSEADRLHRRLVKIQSAAVEACGGS